MKKIQIIYLPGYGGNFLGSLFSLDPNTRPCISLGSIVDTPENRVKCYVEKLQKQKIMHWGNLIDKWDNNSNYPTTINIMHPEQFSFDDSHEIDRFLVDLSWSNFANYWLVTSRQNFNYQIARVEPDEINKQIRIKKKYSPKIISLDAFLNTESWQDEYIRVSQLMGLNYYSVAEELYQLWFNIRVLPIQKTFKNIDSLTNVAVCRSRLEENLFGAPSNWNIFYENIRDSAWPDCKLESDFEKLPEHIKLEIINNFNYNPLTSKN